MLSAVANINKSDKRYHPEREVVISLFILLYIAILAKWFLIMVCPNLNYLYNSNNNMLWLKCRMQALICVLQRKKSYLKLVKQQVISGITKKANIVHNLYIWIGELLPPD